MLNEIIIEYGGYYIEPDKLYRDIFPIGSLQLKQGNNNKFKSNPVGLIFFKERERPLRVIVFDDLIDGISRLVNPSLIPKFKNLTHDFSILNGLTYFGKSNKLESASKMYAMIFDIDGVDDVTLSRLLYGATCKEKIYPIPTYIVCSGNGIHLYYVFDEPINLYPEIKVQLKELKYALTDKLWNMYTSNDKNVQHQGINQGFRVVGSITKNGNMVKGFKFGDKVTLNYLSNFIPQDKRPDIGLLYSKSKVSLEEAKELYPEWYDKVIINKEECNGHWKVNKNLYNWWLRQIRGGATYGHRYFCVLCLVIYGIKCGIEYKVVKQDAYALKDFLNSLKEDDPFTYSDIDSALECYDISYCTFPRSDISKLSSIEIPKNKRNYRKQKAHLYLARRKKEDMKAIGEYINEGRPSKEKIVKEYLMEHSNATKKEIRDNTGLSYPTIRKYFT